MSRKLNRSRRRVFRKKHRWIKPVVWIVVLVLLAVGGYFLASYVMGERTPDTSDTSVPPTESSADTSQDISTEPPVTVPPETEENTLVDINAPVRAVYVPLSVLREKAQNGFDDWMQALAAKGHNSVVVQLKDFTGNVYYQSATAGATAAQVVTETAVSLEELTALREQMTEKGFRLIPQLSAFYDALAPRRLTSARIPYGPDPSQCWLDDAPSAGGKAWLNPYADEAHEYILGYVAELRNAGFTTQMLDGVQFPFQTYLAGFDTTVHKGKSKSEVLSLFISRVEDALGEDGHLMLAATGLSVTSIDMGIYGDNPVDFGADTIVPQLYVDKLGRTQTFAGTKVNVAQEPVLAITLAVRQILTRPDTQSGLTVGIQAYDLTELQIQDMLEAVRSEMGDAASYMLYNPDGIYD